MTTQLAVKETTEAYFIYGAMSAYLLAAVSMSVSKKALGWAVYAVGFVAVTVGYIVRWHNVGHVPMQSMFEVFMCLGVVMFPLSLFCRYVTKVGAVGADCILGFAVLFPAGFVFSGEPGKLPPHLQTALFIPHVAAYMVSYMLMAKAGVQACGQLFCKPTAGGDGLVSYESASYKMVRLGFPLLTLGLILGSVWAKLCWGDYWNWDPKELWSLASWLVYVAYFHFRHVTGRKYEKINSVLVLLGLVAIALTLLWANLSALFSGMHSYAG